jgi:hypothetical protein
MSIAKPFQKLYAAPMAKRRSITRLELIPTVSYSGGGSEAGLVTAKWIRADGSEGEALLRFWRERRREPWQVESVSIDYPTVALLHDVPLERIKMAANADQRIRDWLEQREPTRKRRTREKPLDRPPRPRLERPGSHVLDDAFFEQVAVAYRAAAVDGLSPSKTLATDSDTPPGTVNRWIAEARRRGYLPPAESGKATV